MERSMRESAGFESDERIALPGLPAAGRRNAGANRHRLAMRRFAALLPFYNRKRRATISGNRKMNSASSFKYIKVSSTLVRP